MENHINKQYTLCLNQKEANLLVTILDAYENNDDYRIEENYKDAINLINEISKTVKFVAAV